MTSYLSRLNPVPAFPAYSGPYTVGTVEVEIPVSQLQAPTTAPPEADDLSTIQCRIFYPAAADADGPCISWLPAPQRRHVSAYTQFLGIGPRLAAALSFLPRHLHYTAIPARADVPLGLPPTADGRWPTMVFSHGLGGSRNAYSHVAGSVASHGVVVVCPEHREGSAVLSFVRDPSAASAAAHAPRRAIPYRHIAHDQTPAVWAARDAQLRVRLWEMGLLHEALCAVDTGAALTNLAGPGLEQFSGRLAVHAPGAVIWSGHSFGGATVMQLLKTMFYADTPAIADLARPLCRPAANDAATRLRAQITPCSLVVLLDMWCFPLLSPDQRALWDLPLPAYADVPDAPGGAAVLLVGSQTFFEWTPHLHGTARALSPDPAAAVVSAAAFLRPGGVRLSEPNTFYVRQSAHLNQSDFGLLFPWLTGKIFGAAAPERALRLNLRAILQFLRTNGVPVARTAAADLVDGAEGDKLDGRLADDAAILRREANSSVDAWAWIDIVGLGAGGQEKDAPAMDKDTPDTLSQPTAEVAVAA